MKTILFGGSFNPIHKGHIAIANYTRQQVNAQRVIFIPSSVPFFEKSRTYAPVQHRLAMIEKALLPLPWAEICLHEIQEDLTGVKNSNYHYTIDTFNFLKDNQIIIGTPFLLIGIDLLSHLKDWKDVNCLIHAVHIVIAKRSKSYIPKLLIPKDAILLENKQNSISSSEIRHRIQDNKPYQNYVSPEVYNYIEKYHIYRTDS